MEYLPHMFFIDYVCVCWCVCTPVRHWMPAVHTDIRYIFFWPSPRFTSIVMDLYYFVKIIIEKKQQEEGLEAS